MPILTFRRLLALASLCLPWPQAAFAAPVTLDLATGTTEIHEYFAGDPSIRAWSQLIGGSGPLSLERGVWQTVSLWTVGVGTGHPEDGCCRAETHEFQVDFTAAGITRKIGVDVEMKEILNNQYQYTLLDMDPVEIDLGPIGVLTIDLVPMAFQLLADTPFYAPVTSVSGRLMLSEAAQTLDSPATLPLVLMALSAAAFAVPGALRVDRRSPR